MAVNVTFVPEQIVVAEALIETLLVTTGFTVIVIWLLVTVVVEGQTALLVRMQLITSLSRSAALL